MRDKDHDDFGDLRPPAGVTAGTDCDDSSLTAAKTFPGAAQLEGPLNCMKDADDDGYGDARSPFRSCAAPTATTPPRRFTRVPRKSPATESTKTAAATTA